MFLMQLTPDQAYTPGAILGAVGYLIFKHFVIDAKKNRKDDKMEEKKAQLLEDLNSKVATQIIVSDARRVSMEKLVDDRHEQNVDRLDRQDAKMDQIIQKMDHACHYRRGS